MGLIRPATPGFLVTLIATGLLAAVSFGVPYLKSVFFLRASLAARGQEGSIIFGTLGYCLELNNGTTCSKPSIGYQVDINALVGDKISFLQIPEIAVKWITYVLVLHVVACVLAAVSAVFGLLAHVREMSMTCCSTCISGFAATAAMFAFIFDLVFFFLAKSRINKVQNGKAEIGLAIWLTLAAWVLLFFSGCFYALGRCCSSGRTSRGPHKSERYAPSGNPTGNANPFAHEEAMRLQAIKAEEDRKALAKVNEGGLPSFYEHAKIKPAELQPLTARVDGDEVYVDDPNVPHLHQNQQPQYAGGYVPGAPGQRTIDQYNEGPRRQASAISTQTNQAPNTYPPQPMPQNNYTAPQRQPSAGHVQGPSGYSQYNPSPAGGAAAMGVGAAAAGVAAYAGSQYLSPGQQPGHQQYASGGAYGHGRDNTSYHSAASHVQQPSAYNPYSDPYAPQQPQQPSQQQGYSGGNQSSFNSDAYNKSAAMLPTGGYSQPQPQQYNQQNQRSLYHSTSPPPNQPFAERSYTLGGSGYGSNVVPALQSPHSGTPSPGPGYMPYPGETLRSPVPVLPSPTLAPVNTAGAASYAQGQSVGSGPSLVSSPTQMGSSQQLHVVNNISESPPSYDGPLGGALQSSVPAWDKKR